VNGFQRDRIRLYGLDHLARNREQWMALANMVMNLVVKCWETLE
jgi:hypothetical protein